ncbi:MAG TPA: hypothetical protein VLA51_01530 [Paracoccaceae bacterium]|nr:hypothetical protein [Paracoccaceae bacterium]
MLQTLRNFWRSDAGAVTVDWVVLTAAIIGLGMIVLAPIGFTTGQGAQQIGLQISQLNAGYGNN